MCVKLRHAIFQRSSARKTFSNCGLYEEGRKFNRKPEMVRDMAKVMLLLITNRKWHISFQIT